MQRLWAQLTRIGRQPRQWRIWLAAVIPSQILGGALGWRAELGYLVGGIVVICATVYSLKYSGNLK